MRNVGRIIALSVLGLTVNGAQAADRPTAKVDALAIGPIRFLSYSIHDIPLDSAGSMRDDGVIVGSLGGNAAMYSNGQVTLLPGKTGYANVAAVDIAPNGYIIGYGTSANNVRGLFWASATTPPMDIGGLGRITYPAAINSQGVAVGVYYPQTTSDLPTAFSWSPSTGIHSIAPSGSNQSQAFDVSESGYIAGFAWYGLSQATQRWYPGGATGVAGYSEYAWGVRENGDVYGPVTLWDIHNTATRISPNANALARHVNEAGRKSGYELTSAGWRAWTMAAGSTAVTYLPTPSNASNSFAQKSNSCGTVLGSYTVNGVGKPAF